MVKWKQRPVHNHYTEGTLAKTKVLPDLLQKVLLSRGIEDHSVEQVLNPKLTFLKDPFALYDMDKAVQRLIQAYHQKEKICIYADFDLDGTSGLAILMDAFKKMGFQDVLYYQPKRLSEGYGFHPHAVEELHHLGVSLIVTVDVGITSFAAFEKANELNMQVILTDHHLPIKENDQEILPKAYALINPNHHRCQSGLGYLCGAGVAFYLVRALRKAFSEDPNQPVPQNWDLKLLLDLFCIGTLTDMVPLVDDNRVLVKHGMVVLEKTDRPGLKFLLERLDLTGRQLTSQDVSIRFAPKLNALSRMESDVLPIHIYLEESQARAKSLVDKILENNQTRQSLQSSSEEMALQKLSNWSYKDFVFVSSEHFHRGIIGLIATKLANDFNRPAFVGSINSEGMVVGSSRLPSGFEGNLVEALKYSENELTRFGGHAAAAGFELPFKNEARFIANLEQYFADLKNNPKELEIEFDSVAQLSEINSALMKWHDHLGPYGVGFQIPLFRFNNLQLHSYKELKGGHLKLSFMENNQKMDALFFSPSEHKKKLIQKDMIYDVLGELQMNYFNKSKTIQILVKDFKKNEA